MSNDKITINLGGWPLLITAALCILKLTGVIAISWWWCFCLFWLPFVILFAILGAAFCIFILVLLVTLIIELCKLTKE